MTERINNSFKPVENAFNFNKSSRNVDFSLKDKFITNSDSQAVKINIQTRSYAADFTYTRNVNKPPVATDDAAAVATKAASKAVPTKGARPPDSDVPDLSKLVTNGVYKQRQDGSTDIVFDGISLNVKRDGSVEGQLNSPKGEKLAIKGKYAEGKLEVEVEKIGKYTGELSFNASSNDNNPLIDGTVSLTNVKPVKPQSPKVDASGLFREEANGSKTLEFGGFALSIDAKGAVTGELRAPGGQTLKIEGKYKDGKLEVEVEKLGKFSGNLVFKKDAGANSLADGIVDLVGVRQLSGPKTPNIPQPKPVDPVILDNQFQKQDTTGLKTSQV